MQRTTVGVPGIPKKEFQFPSWLSWLFASIAGILLIFAGISLVNSYSSSQELTANQRPREAVILPPATVTPKATATEEPKPTATAIPTEVPVVVTKPSPTPTPTTLPKIQVKWETPGPFGPYMRLSAGIETIVADSNGTIRVIEGVQMTNRTSISSDYGKTWITRPSTPEELELSNQQWDRNNSSPQYTCALFYPGNVIKTDWECLAEKDKFPTWAVKAINPNNDNQVLVAIPDEKSTLRYSAKLFLTLDGGQSWKEISTPPSGWELGLNIGAVALTTHNGYLELYVGLAQWENNSLLWHATIPLSQLNT